MKPLLELDAVRKSYGDFTAVDGVSLAVEPGSICGLLGPNGAGKTTTIRMIMDIIAPDAGEVRFFGRPRQRDDLLRVGYLPEERGLYRKMTVTDHPGLPRPAARRREAPRRCPTSRAGSTGSAWRSGPARRSRSCPRACSRRSSSSAPCCTSPTC